MKAISAITFILLLVAAGLGAKIYFDQKEQALEYPLHRTITSSDGRSLDVVIHGRSESSLAIERLSDGQIFFLEIAKLSSEDRAMANQLPVNREEAELEEEQKVSQAEDSPDTYIQSRLDTIAGLRSRLVVLENEIKSGSLNSMLLRNREDELVRVKAEIEQLQSAITQYKYRKGIK